MPDHFLGDSHRFKQILINLIGNAIKFTEHGEVTVAVTPETRLEDRICLRVAVSDTGKGVAPEVKRRIFEPFSQADASVTRKHGGTGLGLTISTRLVKLFGGDLDVTNNDNGGATFFFTVCMQLDAAAEAESTRPVLPIARALVIDCSPSHRRLTAELIVQAGVEADEAADTEQGIRMFQEAARANRPYDAVLCEHAPPALDLPALLACLPESAAAGPGTARVIITASLGRMKAARAIDDPRVAGYLIKPVKGRELLGSLAALSREPGQAGADRDSRRGTTGRAADFGNLRILVAEDNKVNQVVVKRILEKSGHRVSIVENGRQALDAIAAETFDLVLMDVQMPVLDGLQATARLRARESAEGLPRLPVVALTAHAMVGDRERCLESGADEYVTKPINAGQLHEVMGNLIGRKAIPVGS